MNLWIQVFGLSCLGFGLLSSVVGAIRAKHFGLQYLRPIHLVIAVMVGLFVYGMIQFPDGPIHICEGGTQYCGKQGQPHSFSDYHRYALWEAAMLVVWPIGLLVAYLVSRKKQK